MSWEQRVGWESAGCDHLTVLEFVGCDFTAIHTGVEIQTTPSRTAQPLKRVIARRR